MCYQVRVAGRIFEGNDVNILLKCAVQARKEMLRNEVSNMNAASMPSRKLGPRPVIMRRQITAA